MTNITALVSGMQSRTHSSCGMRYSHTTHARSRLQRSTDRNSHAIANLFALAQSTHMLGPCLDAALHASTPHTNTLKHRGPLQSPPTDKYRNLRGKRGDEGGVSGVRTPGSCAHACRKRSRQVCSPVTSTHIRSFHYVLLYWRVPAQTLIARSSAPEPLQALGIEVPGPPSPRECFFFARKPAPRAHPLLTVTSMAQRAAMHTHRYAQADHSDGSPQAPLTVYTMRRRQICTVVQTKVNSMLRCRAEARDKIRAEGGGNWRVSA